MANFTYWMNDAGRVMGECAVKKDCIVTKETVITNNPNETVCFKCGKLLLVRTPADKAD